MAGMNTGLVPVPGFSKLWSMVRTLSKQVILLLWPLSQDNLPVQQDELGSEAGQEETGKSLIFNSSAGDRLQDLHRVGQACCPFHQVETLLRQKRFDTAINVCSNALIEPLEADQRSQLLMKRADAYASLGRHICAIPAEQSERYAVFAPDPQHLASKALRDVDDSLQLQSSKLCTLHRIRGDSLYLLERYHEAQDSYRQAWNLCESPTLGERMQKCNETINETAVRSVDSSRQSNSSRCEKIRENALADAECTLCMKLLYEPVTTPCGHTFCRPCLLRSLDHTSKCPMCRAVLHVGRLLPVSVVLKNLLERAFPKEYAARMEEERGSSSLMEQTCRRLPLFVMSPILPGERMALNIFEPRYRLMIRRVMEGGRRFGMATVSYDDSQKLEDAACEVEILDCEPLADGRYYLEIVGRERFKPYDLQELDGYRVCSVDRIVDETLTPGSIEAGRLTSLAKEVESMADTWVGRVRALSQSRRGAADLLRRFGSKPPEDDLERLSFWVVSSYYIYNEL
jgi:Lon protease-like protein/tetratricopeptide (TPR) repeat protein